MATTATARKTAQPLDPGFPKGRFRVAKATDADWQVGLRAHFAYRDLGIAAATEGKVLAQVIRARQPGLLRRNESDPTRDLAAVTGGDPERGKETIREKGCPSCHTIPGIREGKGGRSAARALRRAGLHCRRAAEHARQPRGLDQRPPGIDPLTAMAASGIGAA